MRKKHLRMERSHRSKKLRRSKHHKSVLSGRGLEDKDDEFANLDEDDEDDLDGFIVWGTDNLEKEMEAVREVRRLQESLNEAPGKKALLDTYSDHFDYQRVRPPNPPPKMEFRPPTIKLRKRKKGLKPATDLKWAGVRKRRRSKKKRSHKSSSFH